MMASRGSSPVEKRHVRWDAATSGGGWKMTRGVRLSPVKGVGVGRAEARWWLRAPSGAPAQRREKRRMEELTRYGPSTAAHASGGTPPVASRRGSTGRRLRGQGVTAGVGGGRCSEGDLGGKPEWPVHTTVLGGQGCGGYA
jgi:hypothetical protein